MSKLLNYCLGLKYEIKIVPVSKKDGGGYAAYFPLLGRYTVRGYGKTEIKALKDLIKQKKQYFKNLLDEHILPPELIEEE